MTAFSEDKNNTGPLSPEKYIRSMVRLLPLGKCYINEMWEESGTGSVIVSRTHPNGNITCGIFLVDLFCLGVKDSFYLYNISDKEFEELLDGMGEKEDLLEIKYTLAHNIIYGAIEFAGEYEFKPHKTFSLTQHILEEDTEEIELIDVSFGIDGKPAVLIANNDPKKKVIQHLNKVVGEGNFMVVNVDETSSEDGEDASEESDSDEDGEFDEDDQDFDEEDLEDDSILGNYEDYTDEELMEEIREMGEEETADAIGPIHELFVRLQDGERFAELYEKQSEVFDNITIVNDFNYPGLNFLPGDQLEKFYDLAELTEDNPGESIMAIKKALDEYPNPVYAHLLVSAYGYLGMNEEATRLLKQALEKYSNDFMLRVGYGFILLMDDQFDSLKMFMAGFDLRKVVPERNIFHITEIGRFLCLACNYYALTNQLLQATVYQKILDDFTDIPEGTYYQKLTTYNILSPLQLEYIRENYGKQ